MNAKLSARVRFALKDTTHPGNIGAAARAIKTMGFARLYLAAPKTLIDAQARAMASGAVDILENTKICETLPEALRECAHVFGLSARPRELSPVRLSVREAAQTAAEKLRAGGEIAFVFGGERSGLDNEAMRRCGYAAHIPAAGNSRSLNLAQAVQITAYELRLALSEKKPGEEKTAAAKIPKDMPAQAELEMLYAHFGEFLDDIKMPKRGDGGLLLARLRRLITRAEPDAAEVRMLRGILRAARKKTARE